MRIDDNRDRLLAIKYQQMTWEDVNQWRLNLHAEFDHAFATTHLPERPDYEKSMLF